MLEIYSQNVTVPADSPIPFNSVSLEKGRTATKTGVDTISLNKCGVYMVSFDAVAGAVTSGDVTIELLKDSVAQAQALTSATSASTSDLVSLKFTTLVQVPVNNSAAPCCSGVALKFMNTGVEAEFTNVNVVITKLC